MNLNGDFVNGGLNNLQILKKHQGNLLFLYNDNEELIGIDKKLFVELKIKL